MQNSATYWLPRIEAAGLPVPRTVVVPYDHSACMRLFDGERPAAFDGLLDAADRARLELGGMCFVRTDLASAKHDGSRAWQACSSETLAGALIRTIEDNEMKFWLGPDRPRAFLIRELLELEAPFVAFGGLPIAREWRVFANAERVRCAHPYWPEEALQLRAHMLPPFWRDLLRGLHTVPEEMPKLQEMAMAAAAACGDEACSVDFARDVAGKWWLLDMALMRDSWHWPGCGRAA